MCDDLKEKAVVSTYRLRWLCTTVINMQYFQKRLMNDKENKENDQTYQQCSIYNTNEFT